MNKKVLLLFVPTLLALSSCGQVKRSETYTQTNNATVKGRFIEDTELHEELFGEMGELKVRKSFTPIDSSIPAIGIQTKVDNNGTVEEEDDLVSLRFVAAIEITGDLQDATAVWTRAMFDTSGNAFKASANKASTSAYTSIATLGEPYTIQDYNNASGGHYTHFVAYTMRDIPLVDYSDYYFTAYLTLNDGGETISRVAATTINQNTSFSFDKDDNGYFAIKKTNGGYETLTKDDFDDEGNYHAQFEGVSFEINDSFLVVNRDNSHFQVFGYDNVHANDPLNTDFTRVGSSQFLASAYQRNYYILLDEYNHLSTKEAFSKTLYFKPNSDWLDGSSRYVMTLKLPGETNKRIYEMNRIGETGTYACDVYYVDNLSNTPINFYKMPLSLENDLNNKPHTQDLAWPLHNYDMFTMNKYNVQGSWSLRTEGDPVVDNSNFNITELADLVELHTNQQKEYLSYDGDYVCIPTSDYPDGNAHLSDSLPVEINFTYDIPDGKTVDHYSIVYGQEEDLSDGYEKAGDNGNTITFYNPYLGKNHYKLVAHFTDDTYEESAIHNFYVDATNPRNLTIAGMTNCRDLGGRVLEDGGTFKQGLVYRTSGSGQNGSWNTYKEEAHEEMVNHLGMKNEIYLAERGSNYACSLEDTTVNYFYMDWQATDGSSNFSRNTEPLKKFFNFLADSNNYPVFFHCKIGTDRTGLCGTMLYGLLGVPLNEIYQDYLFSNFGKIGSKRYIGEQAGHDNILRYTEYIQNFSGDTFKNKVYNCLLSIGISKATLNAVINNLTDGPRATGNDAGQLSAFGNQLTPHGVYMDTYDNSLYSNYPEEYYSLTGPEQSVSYTFNASVAYQGQIVAYIGNGDNSNVNTLDYSIGLSLDGVGLELRDVTFYDAGMGYITTSYQRWMYYPVILGIADISAGEHTIEINGREGSFNIAGISILNASTAVDLGGGSPSGKDPKHLHEFGDIEIITSATCEHPGQYRQVCACGEVRITNVPQLQHEFGEAVMSYSAGNINADYYPATTAYNCDLCNKSALRWSALDYDESSSLIENNGSYIRMGGAQQANANNDGVEGGGHLIYKINVPEAVDHVGLMFDIKAHSSNVAIFDTVSGDSGMGKDYVNGQVVNPEKRYALYVNDVRIELGDDPGPSSARAWFTWPVDFSLNAGINKIEIVSMGGYRAQMFSFQLTGLPYVINNHEHQLGSWEYDDYYHWKQCIGEGCPTPDNHYDENYHYYDDVTVDEAPTCVNSGIGHQTCTTCGYVNYVYLDPLGHDWDEGIVTQAPNCEQSGIRRHTCTTCGATYDEEIAPLGHDWDAGVITHSATCTEDGEKEVTCTRCGATTTQDIPATGHSWGEEQNVAAGGEGQVQTYQSICSSDGATRIRISAIDGTFAEGSTNKDGTPAGYIKLSSNNMSISYSFTYSGTATTAKLYQRAIFDSWTSSGNKTSSYSTKGAGFENGCNFLLLFNGVSVDMTATRDIQYQTFFENGTDTGLGSSYSYMADCLIGEIQLQNGLNTFSYTRQQSMNLLVHDYIIVIE